MYGSSAQYTATRTRTKDYYVRAIVFYPRTTVQGVVYTSQNCRYPEV